MAMDWAEQQARDVLRQFRRGTQINGGCVEIYPAVAQAIREAYSHGENTGIAAVTRPAAPSPPLPASRKTPPLLRRPSRYSASAGESVSSLDDAEQHVCEHAR